MFVITSAGFAAIFYFGALVYVFFLLSVLLYYLPLAFKIGGQSTVTRTQAYYLLGSDVISSMGGLLLCAMILVLTKITCATDLWFGHFICNETTLRFGVFILLVFSIFFFSLCTVVSFYARELFDFVVTCVQFCLWFMILFGANSIFAVFFLFELLSTLVFLLLVTSCFSAVGNFHRESLASFAYFAPQLPNFYVNSLLFFFWTSMIASICLFFFSFHLVVWFYSFEWNILELIFVFQISSIAASDFVAKGACWFGLMIAIFIKCGLAPFFVWKPAFFKGIPTISVFFYTAVYYFLLLIFLLFFLTHHVNAIFFGFAYLNIAFFSLGLLVLSLVFIEVSYLKPFFAFSSMLNTLLVFVSLTSSTFIDSMVFF